MDVCIPCRNPQALTDGDSHCRKCGTKTTYVNGRRWSPPKKTNNKAWKRISKGDWLWDHRRVHRVGYGRGGNGKRFRNWVPWERVHVPGHKKGQQGTLTGGFMGRPDIDLGG